jgi:hypothetical protein
MERRVAVLLALLPLACAGTPAREAAPASMMPMHSVVLDGAGVFPVSGDDVTHPRLRYADGQVSLNDTCAIRMDKQLNPKIPPVYINGQPVGFC